jgi:hypothetical protein
MKTISLFGAFLLIALLLMISCKENNSKKDSLTNTLETAVENQAAVPPDFRNSPQYVYCKIDGQPFMTTIVNNSMNLGNRNDFHTTIEEEINGESKLSGIDFSFYSLEKKGAGILTDKDFYVQGHTEFKGKYVAFKTGAGHTLNLTSFKEGLVEGTFNFDLIDERDPGHIVKITDGVFKMQIEGKTNLQFDKNGDVNMDSLLKSIN